jgi:hypothetical protein
MRKLKPMPMQELKHLPALKLIVLHLFMFLHLAKTQAPQIIEAHYLAPIQLLFVRIRMLPITEVHCLVHIIKLP